MAETYRVAIIGSGGISRHHTRGYEACERTEIVAIADVKEESLNRYQTEVFPVESTYTDHVAMLEKEQPDIVSICTYVNSHGALVEDCAARGVKAILCEKPMALNMAEAERMIEVCEQRGVKLAIGHQRRHAAQHQFTKRLIDRGEIGKLVALWASSPPDIMDWGTHLADMMLWYAGEAEWVMGQISGEKVERHARGYLPVTPVVAYVKFKNEAAGVLETDLQARRVFTQPRIHIRGEQGEIEVMMDGGLKYSSWNNLNWTTPNLQPRDAFHLEIEDLCNCIEQDKQPLDSGRDGAKALEILLAISESARQRRKVTLPLEEKAAPLDLMLREEKLTTEKN
jgi:predicted dehydrogenase